MQKKKKILNNLSSTVSGLKKIVKEEICAVNN